MTYDRFGDNDSEPLEPDNTDPPVNEAALVEHKAKCSGWIDRDGDQPKPCLVCRPHLSLEERRRRMGLGNKK